jgi:5-methylcytosine-specific restriction endonuclease McrA
MNGSLPPPLPATQLEFLQNLQRIFEEGQFVASYKFALLHVLADLAVLRGSDTGDGLTLTTYEIAEKFVELYWTQTRPFPGRAGSAVLRQNTGQQAAILSLVDAFQREHGSSPGEARRKAAAWRSLIGSVRRVVEVMPLWKLQVVGRTPLEVLYRNEGRGNQISLLPGVPFCLRRFHGLVIELIRNAWVRYVRTNNGDLLGDATELDEFLFGVDRATLAIFRRILAESQNGRCFYCHAPLGSAAEVDHFIPWTLYPTDLGHNFVLACRACNGDKSDRLAAYPHLEGWWARNDKHGRTLSEAFRVAGIPFDLDATRRIAFWAYGRLEASGGLCWRRDRPTDERMVGLEQGWNRLLSGLAPGQP